MKSDDNALLIVAHGSTMNPDSSAPTLATATEIRRRKIFAHVESAFWKEEPSLRDTLFLFDPWKRSAKSAWCRISSAKATSLRR